MYTSLSICRSVGRSVGLSVCLSACLAVCLSVCLSIYIYTCILDTYTYMHNLAVASSAYTRSTGGYASGPGGINGAHSASPHEMGLGGHETAGPDATRGYDIQAGDLPGVLSNPHMMMYHVVACSGSWSCSRRDIFFQQDAQNCCKLSL